MIADLGLQNADRGRSSQTVKEDTDEQGTPDLRGDGCEADD